MFTASTYGNFVCEASKAQERLFLQYMGPRDDFDIIIAGSGIGGGILADDLAERLGGSKRILLLEAGSFLYPTHVYNFSRFPNFKLAKHFGCDTFWQTGDEASEYYIGERPQLNFGGRSIFWSGLIPTIQQWELDFFPPNVRNDLESGRLTTAGEIMNESRSLGSTAKAILARLQQSALAQDFWIEETPRALSQPYLTSSGVPKDVFFTESTGVFNTAELLVNQLGLTPGVSHGDHQGLQLLLNHFVEDLQTHGTDFKVVARDLATGNARTFTASKVVLAGGSIESPKLLRRSSIYPWLQQSVKDLLGRGLTDHPTTNEIVTSVTTLGDIAITKHDHAKIIFYSKGNPDPTDPAQTRYPFNVEMNVNHEYWHLRENDPNDPAGVDPSDKPGAASQVDIKFSFGNCLDDSNEIKPAASYGYIPEIAFRNQRSLEYLSQSRFPAVAGWNKSPAEVCSVLNDVAHRIFSQFQIDGVKARPANEEWYEVDGKGFGWGTVHHAAGSLRMPYRPSHDSPFSAQSVVDEDLQVVGVPNLYVCDMSVMPFSSAANPVRTLAALALRLSHHLG